jgi:ketosteroid isomerase-like protein
MKQLIFLSFFSFFLNSLFAQINKADSGYLVTLNQQIDSYVVKRDTSALKKLYSDDFVFSHGSGKVEGKSGWLTTVGRADYPLRQHDSVKVELHWDLAIVRGKMKIEKNNKDNIDRYYLRYLRIYALRDKQWQLVSHHTTYEWHEI